MGLDFVYVDRQLIQLNGNVLGAVHRYHAQLVKHQSGQGVLIVGGKLNARFLLKVAKLNIANHAP